MEKQPYVVFRKRHIFVLGKRRCFGNRYVFGNYSKATKMGHMAGPLLGNGANHWASSSDWALGPNLIRLELRLLEAPG